MRLRVSLILVWLCLLAASFIVSVRPPWARAAAAGDGSLRFVIVLTRHGVRSPTHPNELAPYAAQKWPAWEVAPGDLTPHGAALMRQFGAYYRSFYVAQGLVPAMGCPSASSIYVWADLDRRTLDTGRALLQGLAPGCGVSVQHATGSSDPLFDPLPAYGRADSALSMASVRGAIGDDPAALTPAYHSAWAALDRVLGCTTACKQVSQLPTTIDTDPDTGLASISGGLDAAGTASEDLLLEYADGHRSVGWGRADASTILEVMRLHSLKARLEHETYYNARAEGSNLLAHIAELIDQAASGRANAQAGVPLDTRLAVIVGHDTSLAKMAGMLHLSWLLKGYLINDTPPGGALTFELYAPASAPPFVRLYFTAQSLDEMRSGQGSRPGRVPVYIPGCPTMECPLSTFDEIIKRSLDTRFVGTPW